MNSEPDRGGFAQIKLDNIQKIKMAELEFKAKDVCLGWRAFKETLIAFL